MVKENVQTHLKIVDDQQNRTVAAQPRRTSGAELYPGKVAFDNKHEVPQRRHASQVSRNHRYALHSVRVDTDITLIRACICCGQVPRACGTSGLPSLGMVWKVTRGTRACRMTSVVFVSCDLRSATESALSILTFVARSASRGVDTHRSMSL